MSGFFHWGSVPLNHTISAAVLFCNLLGRGGEEERAGRIGGEGKRRERKAKKPSNLWYQKPAKLRGRKRQKWNEEEDRKVLQGEIRRSGGEL